MASVMPEVTALLIEKMSDGGYVVSEGIPGMREYPSRRFASSAIEDALKYAKKKLDTASKI